MAKDTADDSMGSDGGFTARIAPGVATIDQARWDTLAGSDDPFLSHRFLALLEDAGSVGAGTGWQSAPVLVEDDQGLLTGVAPAYLKQHSQGEYVFDRGWAEAWQRAGGAYYPKLQIAVPFTPVLGRRLLVRDDDSARAMIAALEMVTVNNGLSSAHATFVDDTQIDLFRDADWLIRRDTQYHWHNRDYADFDTFLAALSSRKRKAIRKERAAAQSAVWIEALTGDALQPQHWDVMWACYQDTGARKWGRPYLTRETFALIGQRMAENVLLFIAYDRASDQPVAAALNFIGRDALYGRYWGTLTDIPCLHFELSYYQAIEYAITHGLSRVEAGAQGTHKLARGYEPVATWSAHFIPHTGFRAAIADYLAREVPSTEEEAAYLERFTPFRKDG